MAWCPYCKNEYRDGIEECSECHIPLVQKLEDSRTAIYFDTEEKVNKIVNFLVANDITSASIGFDEKEEVSELYVLESEESRAKKLLNIFIKEEQKQEEKNTNNETEELQWKSEEDKVKEFIHPKQPAGAFVSKRHKAEEHKSSAYVLIFVGLLGIVSLVLIERGVIPFSMPATTKYMSYFLMGLLFLVFLVMGILSIKSYKKLTGEAATEEDGIEVAKKWLKETITKEYLQDKITENAIGQHDMDNNEETIYFVRMEYMTEALKEQFSYLDEILVEQLADDYYCELFE